MRPRRPASDQQEAVARRLELLSAELAAVRAAAEPEGDLEPPDDTALVGDPAPDTHTRVRPAPEASSRAPASPTSAWPPAAAEWAVGPVPEWEEEPSAVPPGEGGPWLGSTGDPAEESTPHPGPALPTPGRHASRRATADLASMVPETLRGRVVLTSHHLTLIALAVALGLGVTAWWVVRGDAVSQPVASPVAPVEGLVDLPDPDAGAATAGARSTGSPAPPDVGGDEAAASEVVVDVAGRVRRPGIVVLPAGSRVADALERAGGARPRVDLAGLNLARVLVDGEQILVGVEPVAAPQAGAPAPGSPPGAASGAGAPLVNINTADQVTLETLPGVGPVTAAAILEWRTSNGAFSSVEELVEVNGIGPATLARLQPLVTL